MKPRIFLESTHSPTLEVGWEISATPHSFSHPSVVMRECGLVSTVALL